VEENPLTLIPQKRLQLSKGDADTLSQEARGSRGGTWCRGKKESWCPEVGRGLYDRKGRVWRLGVFARKKTL